MPVLLLEVSAKTWLYAKAPPGSDYVRGRDAVDVWLSHASTSIHWKGFLSGFVLEGEMSGVLYFELSSCQMFTWSKLCLDHLFCLLLSAHAVWQPAWAKSSRQNRWSKHMQRQEYHLWKKKNIALGTFLNSGLALWANKQIQASSHHMHTLTSEHKKNKWRNTCEVLWVFDFTLHLCKWSELFHLNIGSVIST